MLAFAFALNLVVILVHGICLFGGDGFGVVSLLRVVEVCVEGGGLVVCGLMIVFSFGLGE